MASGEKITIVLVDDSSVIRGALSRILSTDPDIEIVGSVSNGEMAISTAERKKPDILILDVEMPVMDGIVALPKILEKSPGTRVIMCSSLTEKGAGITMKALSLGAVECFVKPSSAQDTGPGSAFQKSLLNLIKTLGKSSPQHASATKTQASSSQGVISPAKKAPTLSEYTLKVNITAFPKPDIIAIGSSTGGPQALFEVLKNLKDLKIPIVITQHMPATFTKILAEHIQQQTGIPTQEGKDDMVVMAGSAYVAPGGKHMIFKKIGAQIIIKLDDGPLENFCKPAVDPMLRSLVDIYGARILCAILTGMGQDGLLGAQILVKDGGCLIAQDQSTSVVWGMPGAVAMNGICSKVLPLMEIGPWLRKNAA